MITDHYRGKWPLPDYSKPEDISVITITIKEWQKYQELKRKAQEYDERTNQPDRVKPDVAEWEAKIEEIIERKIKENKENK
jgi:hypothetical protein